MSYLPKDIDTSRDFMGTSFKNIECEITVRKIAILLQAKSMHDWKPFTYGEFNMYFQWSASHKDEIFLRLLVEGGRTSPESSNEIDPGWLEYDGVFFTVTEKLVNWLGQNFSK